MTPLQEEVLTRAEKLNKEWNCHGGIGDDAIISCEDPRIEILEHVCHELAHALTLGVELGDALSARNASCIRKISSNYEDGCDFIEENELECHVIVMRVLRRLGFTVSTESFRAAAEMQMATFDVDIFGHWKKYARTRLFEASVQSLLSVLVDASEWCQST